LSLNGDPSSSVVKEEVAPIPTAIPASTPIPISTAISVSEVDGPQKFGDASFVHVPAGEFQMGSNSGDPYVPIIGETTCSRKLL
jgi:hypothetical protein